MGVYTLHVFGVWLTAIFKSPKHCSGKAILNSPSTLPYFYNPFGTHFPINEKPIFSREANKQNLISSPQDVQVDFASQAHEVKVFLILAMYIFLAGEIFSGHYPWCSLDSQLIHPNWLASSGTQQGSLGLLMAAGNAILCILREQENDGSDTVKFCSPLRTIYFT